MRSAIAFPFSTPGYQASRTDLTSPSQGMLTGAPASMTTTVFGLAAATRGPGGAGRVRRGADHGDRAAVVLVERQQVVLVLQQHGRLLGDLARQRAVGGRVGLVEVGVGLTDRRVVEQAVAEHRHEDV